MNMVHYDPYKMITRHGDFGRLLDTFMPRFEHEEAANGYDWAPAVDIKEEKQLHHSCRYSRHQTGRHQCFAGRQYFDDLR